MRGSGDGGENVLNSGLVHAKVRVQEDFWLKTSKVYLGVKVSVSKSGYKNAGFGTTFEIIVKFIKVDQVDN